MKDNCTEKKRNELKIMETSRLFKALGDPNRLCILDILMREEKCACELLAGLEIGQSTLSHHMMILAEAGLINCRKVGKWTHYSLNREGWTIAIDAMTGITKNWK